MNERDEADPPPTASRRNKGGDMPLEAFAAALAPGSRLIGIDLGTTTIGLALSDVTRIVASALYTIERTKFRADAERLLATAVEHGVGGLVVGLPVNMNGSEGPRAQATRAFVRNLAPLTALPILFWDERLSTEAAERMLIAADTSRRRRGEVIDKLAATLILQGALDRLRHLRPTPVEDDEAD
jgi:putative Holliday junction resolvase